MSRTTHADEGDFGLCPHCHGVSCGLENWDTRFLACDEHKVCWVIAGRGLSHSELLMMTSGEKERLDSASKVAAEFAEVKPYYPSLDKGSVMDTTKEIDIATLIPSDTEPLVYIVDVDLLLDLKGSVMSTTDKIVFTLERTNFYTRLPCTVCGGCTDKDDIICESSVGYLCHRCIRDGNLDRKLEAHAAGLERRAAQVRGLIGRLQAPSYQDLLDAERAIVEEDEEAELADMQGEAPDKPFLVQGVSVEQLFVGEARP
jgi:hypothetical protein